ncbi:nitrogen permease regulator of amino acid transport activity 3-domain-containing protein [Phellopilus nigrolimitatus]|nr:nitrogen permease regulator of amino acid transport activity 3-domain-containing protein [Phellopilus nigrolimitatus]
MAESLLAVFLVASSAKGSNLIFHWPPYPSGQPRLARPKPQHDGKNSLLDNVWLAATNNDIKAPDSVQPRTSVYDDPVLDEWDYEWRRPNGRCSRSRSLSFAESTGRSRPGSRRASPSKDAGLFDHEAAHRASSFSDEYEYENLLGFPAEFLANILCPQDDMCHQKFELIVDDLAFIGHPVCAETDVGWRFKNEQSKNKQSRGRESRTAKEDETPLLEPVSPEAHPSKEPIPVIHTDGSSPPSTFHLVFVIDLPDPSSSASGNVFKYFHVIYEQLAFTVTAVLFQEQVLNSFVDKECETLGALREAAYSRSAPFAEFVAQALDGSSLARAMKTLYEAVKTNAIARLVINEVGVEVQLPPQLDNLLHAEEENPDFVEHPDPGAVSWGPELSFGWGLPSLAPWKSLLLYDVDEEHNDLKMNLSRPGLSPEDQMLAEGLVQFLETVSIFDSLAVVAHSLDWSLERQVYPTVRWLVYHRRAKIVDTVHRGLRTVFALSSRMEHSLPEMTADFSKAFPHTSVPPLPKLFASISNPASFAAAPFSPSLSHSKSHSHSRLSAPAPPSERASSATAFADFFASAVRSKDLIPLYQDVVVWLLRRELLVALHLHVRIVATPAVKEHVRRLLERAAKRRFERRLGPQERGRERRRGSAGAMGSGTGAGTWSRDEYKGESFVARSRPRRFSNRSAGGGVFEGGITRSFKYGEGDGLRSREVEEDDAQYRSRSRSQLDEEGDEENEIDDEDDLGSVRDEDRADDNQLLSIIPEPGQATPLQRKWIEAMSEGKSEEVSRRFQIIHQYFDGKCTDDEIMYRAEITRKQFREVLQQYDEYLLTSLHPA